MKDTNIEILVVDDFSSMRRVIINMLSQLDYKNFTEAEDGQAAFELLEKQPFDFVVTDWDMPRMKGIDLLKKIKSDNKLKNIPVLLVTAESNPEKIEEAMQAGANGYLIKPFNVDILKEKIEGIF